METQLTRRGKGLAVVAIACVALAAVFGARSLNAIVAPAALALLAAVVIVRRAPVPTADRTVPPDGHPDERHEVRLDVDGCGAASYGFLDRVGDGINANGNAFDVTGDRASITYDVAYGRRGVYEFGPLTATVTDVLGLAERSVTVDTDRDQVLVYPELVDPPGSVRRSIDAVVDLERRPGRDEFDRLREYVRGDSPRDVHWKSSAKRPDDDLVVKEFDGRAPTDAVRIAVAPTGSRDAVDSCARAAASVAATLLAEDVEVGIETDRETIEPTVGAAQREAILAALARLTAGAPSPGDETIRITSADGDALVHAGGRAVPFSGDGAVAGDARRSSADGDEPLAGGDAVRSRLRAGGPSGARSPEVRR